MSSHALTTLIAATLLAASTVFFYLLSLAHAWASDLTRGWKVLAVVPPMALVVAVIGKRYSAPIMTVVSMALYWLVRAELLG